MAKQAKRIQRPGLHHRKKIGGPDCNDQFAGADMVYGVITLIVSRSGGFEASMRDQQVSLTGDYVHDMEHGWRGDSSCDFDNR
jgi:hypothetical protein